MLGSTCESYLPTRSVTVAVDPVGRTEKGTQELKKCEATKGGWSRKKERKKKNQTKRQRKNRINIKRGQGDTTGPEEEKKDGRGRDSLEKVRTKSLREKPPTEGLVEEGCLERTRGLEDGRRLDCGGESVESSSTLNFR